MIYIGADHGGYELKEQVKHWLTEWGMEYTDVGAHTLDPQDDYPSFAFAVAEGVAQSPGEHKGVIACRSAAGVVIAANKVRSVRAVAPFTQQAAVHSREHNDTNVIGLSGDWLKEEDAKRLLHSWLTTPFSGEERHARRVEQIRSYEKDHFV